MSDNSNIDLENSKDKNSPNLVLELQESFSSSNKSNNDHEIIKALNKSPLKAKRKDHLLLKESFQEHDNDKTFFTSDNSEVKKNMSSNSVNLKHSKNKLSYSTDNNSIILPNPQSPKKKRFSVFKMVEKERYKKYYESPTKKVQIEGEIEKGRERRDYYGTEIKKKNRRKVKISFVDEINEDKPLAEVINIENYKKYNYIIGMPSEANFNRNLKANCQCCITF